MKLFYTIYLLFLLCFVDGYSNEIILEEHYKVVNTFSGDIDKKDTFHLIIAKNKKNKKYEIIPVSYFNTNLVRLPSISFKSKPSIISYHSNNDGITLVISTGGSEPVKKALGVNLITGKYTLSEKITRYNLKAALRKKDKSLLITNNFSDLKISQIHSVDSINSFLFKKNKKNSQFFKRVQNSVFSPVNTDDFVKNGPISTFKVYYVNDILCFTRDDFYKKLTSIVRFNFLNGIDDKDVDYKEFIYERFKEVKEVSTYLYNNKLYQLLLGKKSGFININDIVTGEFKSISLKEVIGSTDLQDFLKESTKGKYKSTITVNMSSDGKRIVRCDYVDSTIYGYNYNWWFHHQQFMWHQQHMMQNVPSFGPSNLSGDFNDNFFNNNDKHYFEIVLDENGGVLKNAKVNYELKDIDKKKHTKSVDDDESIKHVSSVFIDNLFIYFYLDLKANSFKVSNKSINYD